MIGPYQNQLSEQFSIIAKGIKMQRVLLKYIVLPLCCSLFVACGGGVESGATEGAKSKSVGPTLQVPTAMLEAALSCTPDVIGAKREVVLIMPAFSTAEQSFSGYLKQLPALNIPTCSITLPDHGFEDLQVAAEYVVYAVRKIARQSGQKVILFGHQHGPLDQLWALTFWPDLTDKIVSLISLATPYQGTMAASSLCNSVRNCSPSVWQIASGSSFTEALLSRPLPKNIAITSISTNFDEVILPQPSASARVGITQIVLQDICPGRLVEHFTILMDNLAYELVLDAINHPGLPADRGRLAEGICSGPIFMPTPSGSGNSGTFDSGPGFFLEFPVNNITRGVSSEPPLRDYARAF